MVGLKLGFDLDHIFWNFHYFYRVCVCARD